jgi:AcrR family transcriptional regulator
MATYGTLCIESPQTDRLDSLMPAAFGRPRDSSLDAAIITATQAVLLDEGYSAVNIDRVAKLAGTTRAAVYRRASNATELVVLLLISRFGIDPAPDSGELRQDLLLLQRLQRQFFSDPVVQAALAGALTAIRDNDALAASFYDRFMAPRRTSVAAMLARAAKRGEINLPQDPAVISDLLTGPLLLRTLMPFLGSLDDALIDATVTAALSALVDKA